MGSGASFRSTEQHRVTQVSQEQDASDSQPVDGVFCTAFPLEVEAEINEASTLLSVVTTGKATTEGSTRSKRVSAQTNPPSHCFQGSTWTARGRKEDRHGVTIACTHKESYRRRCTRAQRFHSEHDHWRVAGRHGSHPGSSKQPTHLDACTQNSSPSSCRVHTKRGICRDRRWAHWRAHEGPVRLARRPAGPGTVTDQQLQRGTRQSQKPSAVRR